MKNLPQIQRSIGGMLSWCCPRLWLVMLVSAGVWGQPAQFAQAGVMLHVDFDPHMDGIQSSLSVLQGESFTANLVMEFSDDTSAGLDAYSFSVAFDNAGMSFVMAKSIPVAGFIEFPLPPELTVDLNAVSSFAADVGIDNIGLGPAFPFSLIVGTIDFQAGTTLGTFYITPYEDQVFDGFFDNGLDAIEATFNAGSVTITGTVIPEPTSAAIMLTALAVGIVLYRHRRFVSGQALALRFSHIFCSTLLLRRRNL